LSAKFVRHFALNKGRCDSLHFQEQHFSLSEAVFRHQEKEEEAVEDPGRIDLL
jgi:hypothetical protein